MIPYFTYLKLGFTGIIVIMLLYFYYDYNRLQNKTLELTNQIKKFETDVILQGEHIRQLENNFEKQKIIRNGFEKQVKIINKELDDIQEKIYEHDFAHIASKKPKQLEDAINNGTLEIIRCFELATGAEALTNEKNKSCPTLINSN